jgi:hypothetical protein
MYGEEQQIRRFWRENLKIIIAWNESENNNETVFHNWKRHYQLVVRVVALAALRQLVYRHFIYLCTYTFSTAASSMYIHFVYSHFIYGQTICLQTIRLPTYVKTICLQTICLQTICLQTICLQTICLQTIFVYRHFVYC